MYHDQDDDEEEEEEVQVPDGRFMRRLGYSPSFRKPGIDGIWRSYTLCHDSLHFSVEECEALGRSRVGGQNEIIDCSIHLLGPCDAGDCLREDNERLNKLPVVVLQKLVYLASFRKGTFAARMMVVTITIALGTIFVSWLVLRAFFFFFP